MNWESALKELKAGNERFRKQQLLNDKHDKEYLEELANGQSPLAIVLSCSDSRVSPDILFDQRLGGIFIIQNAGNVVGTTIIGSIEYAVKYLKCPLIIVLGHSKCGAVSAAMDGYKEETCLKQIVNRISPSVSPEKTLDQAIKDHASNMANSILEKDFVQAAKVKVLSAYYEIDTGEIDWHE